VSPQHWGPRVRQRSLVCLGTKSGAGRGAGPGRLAPSIRPGTRGGIAAGSSSPGEPRALGKWGLDGLGWDRAWRPRARPPSTLGESLARATRGPWEPGGGLTWGPSRAEFFAGPLLADASTWTNFYTKTARSSLGDPRALGAYRGRDIPTPSKGPAVASTRSGSVSLKQKEVMVA